MSNKLMPKGCNCKQCRRGKGTKAGGQLMKMAERSFRHAQNSALRRGEEDILPAGTRPHTD